MSNSRELSKIFTADTELATDSEMIVMVTSASTHAMNEAMSYVDSEISVIDLSSTIITASAAAAGYADNQINSASTSLTNTIDNLTTSDIVEGDNKYFTNQRAIDAGSATYLPLIGGTITSNLQIDGTLTVSGSTAYVNVTEFKVEDPMIYLAGNSSANLVDIGFVGNYNDGSYAHTGLVKDATDGKWKFFSSVETEPTGTIEFSEAVYDTVKASTFEGNLSGSATYISHTGVIGLAENYEPNIQYVSASPSGPNAGTLWLDSTASAAPLLKVYNGSTWIAVSGADSGLHPFFTAGI